MVVIMGKCCRKSFLWRLMWFDEFDKWGVILLSRCVQGVFKVCFFVRMMSKYYLCGKISQKEMVETERSSMLSKWALYKREYVSLLKLGLPVLVAELGVIAVSFADTMMVGDYGTRELAAAAFVNNIFTVVVVMLIGFASGITPLIGALYSQRKNYDAGKTLRVSLQLNFAMSMVCTIVMGGLYFFLDKMDQPEELLPLIRSYYLIVLSSMVPLSIFNCCQQMANGITHTSMPMWLVLGANVLNIIGNYVLIYGHFGAPELGLDGAGISTAFSRLISAVAIVVILLTSKRYRPYMKGLRYRGRLRAERKKVFVTSYPIMIQSGIECLLWSFGAVVSGWFGVQQLASYQILIAVSHIGFMTYISFGIATSIKVSNYMGVKDFVGIRRVTKTGLSVNLMLGTIASLIFLVFGRDLLELFTNDIAVIDLAVLMIPPLVLYQYGDAIQITYANALRGTSHVKPLLWVSLVCYIIIGIPFLRLLAEGFDMKNVGVFYSFSGALFSAALLLYLSYKRAVRIEYDKACSTS